MFSVTPSDNDALTSVIGPSDDRASQRLLRVGRFVSSFPALMIAFLIGKVLFICRDRIADPDLWWHLRNAQLIFANHRFPNVDIFSLTAAGSRWMDHEWLSEVFYYVAFQFFGLDGIILLTISILALMITAVFCTCLRQVKDPFAAAIATFLGSVLATVGFGPRTQHFGWLCFIGVYMIMLHFRTTRRGPLWLVPLIFAVWINCHGSWVVGLLVYGIFLGAGLIRRDIGRLRAHPWSRTDLRKLAVTGIASIAALFLNPFGYRLVLYPFDMIFRQKLNTTNVEEWASVNFNDPRGILVAIVLAAIFAAALISKRQWRIDDALLTGFFMYSGLTHVRFLLLAGIALPPILTHHLGNISSYNPQRERRLINSVLLAVVAVACTFGYPSTKALNAQQSEFFPLRALDFLRDHPQSGHIFNFYNWGGYLEWALPQTPTFIDSRTDIFEYNGTLQDYLDVCRLANSQEILDRYKVSYVLYPSETPLSYFLSMNPRWERIYGDSQAVIYRRAATH